VKSGRQVAVTIRSSASAVARTRRAPASQAEDVGRASGQ